MDIDRTQGSSLLTETHSGSDCAVVDAEIAGAQPEELFQYWTNSQLITEWWPQEAEIEAHAGGAYVLRWPRMEWTLRGRYTEFMPAQRLGFTWHWDHEPDTPERQVSVIFEPLGATGTRITVKHGIYTASASDQDERRGHVEGWLYFLGRLSAACEAKLGST